MSNAVAGGPGQGEPDRVGYLLQYLNVYGGWEDAWFELFWDRGHALRSAENLNAIAYARWRVDERVDRVIS